MSRSTYFAALLVVVAAAVFAPLSQAMTLITDNSPSQNRITLRNLRIASTH